MEQFILRYFPELFFLLYFPVTAFLFLLLIVLSFLCWNEAHKTGRKGSRYYVPPFKPGPFEKFTPGWTLTRRQFVARDKAQWQDRFDRGEG
jgi:hypothetical protein